MASILKIREIISLIILSLLFFNNSLCFKQFTATDLWKMKKLSGTAVSPDGKYAAYSISQWNDATGKTTSFLEYIEIATGVVKPLTKGEHDSSPVFNSDYPGLVFYQSGGQVWYVSFPPGEELSTPQQLTQYPVSIGNILFKGSSLVFSADVYFDCLEDVFACTAKRDKEIEDRGENSWGVYDKMFVRHWDTWYVEGKGSHVFYQQIDQDSETKQPKIDSAKPVRDLMRGMEANSPIPPFGGLDNMDLSNDGTGVVFTLHERNQIESWNTSWKTYYFNINASNSPLHITKRITARTQTPKFSPDGSKIAYLAMNRPKLESDNLHLEVYDTFSGRVTILTDKFDRSVVEYMWLDGNTILFVCTEIQVNRLFVVNLNKPNSVQMLTNDYYSYNSPILVDYEQKKLIAPRVSWGTPAELSIFTFNSGLDKSATLSPALLYNPNKDTLAQFELNTLEEFNFTGGYNEKVYGWVLKPVGFDPSKTYPLAFLIHGGPEGVWKSGFSFGWLPHVWANRGYAVVMVNPHGSDGLGVKFKDAVRDDWGGVPYTDLMTGLDYALANYKWIDSNRMCACGASYGGYMVNWIQGQTDRFKCLVTHDGVFSTLNMFYATEEIWFPYAEYCPRDNVGCNPFDPKFRERYLKFSPEAYVQNWKTPHMIIHGSRDYRIPIAEGLSAFTALQVRGVPSKFLHFDLENHWVLRAENSVKWFDEVLAWMDQYTNTKFEVRREIRSHLDSNKTHAHSPNVMKHFLQYLDH